MKADIGHPWQQFPIDKGYVLFWLISVPFVETYLTVIFQIVMRTDGHDFLKH